MFFSFPEFLCPLAQRRLHKLLCSVASASSLGPTFPVFLFYLLFYAGQSLRVISLVLSALFGLSLKFPFPHYFCSWYDCRPHELDWSVQLKQHCSFSLSETSTMNTIKFFCSSPFVVCQSHSMDSWAKNLKTTGLRQVWWLWSFQAPRYPRKWYCQRHCSIYTLIYHYQDG